MKVYGSRNSNTFEDWNDFIMLQEMEETTNVHIEWELVEDSTYNDTRSIKLTSGDLPDVVKNGLTATEIIRYGNDGLFIPLDELQEKYAPNYMAAMDSDYGKQVCLKACSTTPDGPSLHLRLHRFGTLDRPQPYRRYQHRLAGGRRNGYAYYVGRVHRSAESVQNEGSQRQRPGR